MLRNKLQSGWILVLIAAAIVIGLGSATVAGDLENNRWLERENWWPYATGLGCRDSRHKGRRSLNLSEGRSP